MSSIAVIVILTLGNMSFKRICVVLFMRTRRILRLRTYVRRCCSMLVRGGFVGACFVVAGRIVSLYACLQVAICKSGPQKYLRSRRTSSIYGATCIFTGFVSVATPSVTGFFGAIVQSRALILVIADAFLESHEMD